MMIAAILADDKIRREIEEKGVSVNTEIVWVDSLQSLRIVEADAYFDFQFENDRERISRLKYLLPKPVFINSVAYAATEIGESFIRVNGWPTMINRPVVEIAFAGDSLVEKHVADVFGALGWKFHIVPDVAGMVTPRIAAMIINEAYYAFGEDVSSKDAIDKAMKLGTNYPFGPFEWVEKIGIEKIRELLFELSRTDQRYEMAPLLKQI